MQRELRNDGYHVYDPCMLYKDVFHDIEKYAHEAYGIGDDIYHGYYYYDITGTLEELQEKFTPYCDNICRSAPGAATSTGYCTHDRKCLCTDVVEQPKVVGFLIPISSSKLPLPVLLFRYRKERYHSISGFA